MEEKPNCFFFLNYNLKDVLFVIVASDPSEAVTGLVSLCGHNVTISAVAVTAFDVLNYYISLALF